MAPRRGPTAGRSTSTGACLATRRRASRRTTDRAPARPRALSVKDESRRLGLPAFKVLGASWAVYRLLSDRLGGEPAWRDLGQLRAAVVPLGPLTLVAATDGNHGRAGRARGSLARPRHADLRARRHRAGSSWRIASEGALVIAVDGTYEDAVAASAAEASTDTLVVSDTSWPGYTEVPRNVIEGYETIFAEVDTQAAGARRRRTGRPRGRAHGSRRARGRGRRATTRRGR